MLATERVRYVGDPVAAVFAEDPYIAEDAADLVEIAVEQLPVMLDAAAAPRASSRRDAAPRRPSSGKAMATSMR